MVEVDIMEILRYKIIKIPLARAKKLVRVLHILSKFKL